MTLRIADTFTAALTRLTAQEQAAAKQAAFDLQVDPSAPGLSLHRVDRSRDRDFWTARVTRDLRIVLHRRGPDTLLAWVGHHDDAYDWAERRRLEVHPTTGAAQLVEVRERVEEIRVHATPSTPAAVPPPALFARTPEETLLRCGVPPDWLADVRAATDDTLFDLTDHLPAEAMEALLNLAVGIEPGTPAPPTDPFAHPDAQRRFRLLVDEEELRRALDAPWERWTIFLHPAQREFVARDFAGPARVTGSAGTGKTVVALHRAVRLARDDPSARVLLTTYNALLAEGLRRKLALLGAPPNLTASDLRAVALAEHERLLGPVRMATEAEVHEVLASAAESQPVDPGFLRDEWRLVVDARDVRDPAIYRDLPRHGRKTRLTGDRREALWAIFDRVRGLLAERGLKTYAGALHDTAHALADASAPPFDHIIVDEAQDLSLAELRFLRAACAREANGLFFAGDIGQRIFRPAFAWSAEGVEIRGRSRSLKVNYRTSHQIRRRSDHLLPARLLELNGGEEDRTGVQSVFEGPSPSIQAFRSAAEEASAVARWIGEAIDAGIAPEEIGVLVRSLDELDRALEATRLAGRPGEKLVGRAAPAPGLIALAPMHLAKGLEFRAVAVMACDAGVIPSEARLLEANDERALEEVYATERHLLYVACTRARERLMVSGVTPVSEYLEDLLDEGPA
ncbi:3'-5' exonuclease [Amaricoccus sp. W119]|uniref:3'-5' exonuclease n=1 Tax=Amaricoccus sp. W119 TaxID=3391833 RepID=UPI0039A649D0